MNVYFLLSNKKRQMVCKINIKRAVSYPFKSFTNQENKYFIFFQKTGSSNRRFTLFAVFNVDSSFIFMQFLAKKLPNNRLALPSGVGASSVWEILDPPLVTSVKVKQIQERKEFHVLAGMGRHCKL